MRVAQQLYEGVNIGSEGQVGLITYMRTDSVNLSESAQRDIGDVIRATFGERYTIREPRTFKSKAKGRRRPTRRSARRGWGACPASSPVHSTPTSGRCTS